MRYDYNNSESINDIYIHDSIFKGLFYDYEERKIKFSCNNFYLKKLFNLFFYNVIFFRVQSCMFWGSGCYITDISSEIDSQYLNELTEIQQEMNQREASCDVTALNMGKKYISVELGLNSGDVIIIICESFEIEESNF